MESLSDRLKALGVKLGPQPGTPANLSGRPPDAPASPAQPARFPIENIVRGAFRPTIYGEVFASEELRPKDAAHGICRLLPTHSRRVICEWGQAPHLEQADFDNFVFLDTETTGLSGGTGTYAFMVGLGRSTPAGFRLVQFFLRGPDEEPALLAALSEFMTGCQAIVTFNGKSFDAPLLNTRYTLQGLTSPLTGLAHLDLLPLARRLWRDRLPSRRLGYLESTILQVERTQDEVPGYLIPEMYFNYLRSGDARPMEGVFYHNAMDIYSLAALFNHTTALLADPLSLAGLPGLDRVALARLYEDLGYLDTAIRLYETGLDDGLPDEFFWKTVERFAQLYKHQKNWEPALALWRKAADHRDLYALEELAKYYEHTEVDISAAIHWTEQALDRVGLPDYPRALRRQATDELGRRLERLKKKRKA